MKQKGAHDEIWIPQTLDSQARFSANVMEARRATPHGLEDAAWLRLVYESEEGGVQPGLSTNDQRVPRLHRTDHCRKRHSGCVGLVFHVLRTERMRAATGPRFG